MPYVLVRESFINSYCCVEGLPLNEGKILGKFTRRHCGRPASRDQRIVPGPVIKKLSFLAAETGLSPKKPATVFKSSVLGLFTKFYNKYYKNGH